MSLQLTDVWRYPVKSCRGERLSSAAVEPWGLAGDRRWMIVDGAGDPVTAREHPPLLLVTPRVEDGKITLAGPGLADVTVPVPSAGYSFGTLRTAQADGDADALSAKGRPIVRIHLGRNVERGLEQLTALLARRPRGYPTDHPRLPFLRWRGLHVDRAWPAGEWLSTEEPLRRVAAAWRAARPLADWLEAHVGPREQVGAPRRPPDVPPDDETP